MSYYFTQSCYKITLTLLNFFTDDIESTHIPVVDKDEHELPPVPETDDHMDEDTGFDIDDILNSVKFDDEAAPFKPIVVPTFESSSADDSMMMVETASVSSENIDQVSVVWFAVSQGENVRIMKNKATRLSYFLL